MLYATVRQRKIHVKNPTTVIQNGINVDELILDMDDEWKEMTSITCVFITRYTTETKTEDGKTETEEQTTEIAMEHEFGKPVRVPWENLQHTGMMSVSCTGYVGSDKVMTTMAPDSFWTVVQNGATDGTPPIAPTQSLISQITQSAADAKAAAEAANQTAQQLLADAESGKFDGAPGEKGEKGDPGEPGKDGKDGKNGKDGVSPEVSVIVDAVLAELPVYKGEVVSDG